MRALLTTVAEITGAMSVTVGAFLWNVPAGFVTGGVFAIAGGYLFADGAR